MLDTLADTRRAIRSLWRTPGFTLAALAILASGVIARPLKTDFPDWHLSLGYMLPRMMDLEYLGPPGGVGVSGMPPTLVATGTGAAIVIWAALIGVALLRWDPTGYEAATPEPAAMGSRPPRLACLLALAHRFEQLVKTGAVRDYAEIARLGGVSRARVSQILNLLALAPSIQEQILFLSPRPAGDDPLTERDLRRVVRELEWDRQRQLFERLAG